MADLAAKKPARVGWLFETESGGELIPPDPALFLRLALDEFADDRHPLALAFFLIDFVHAADSFVLRHRLPHFRQREILELANAFTCDVEFLADLLERELFAAFEAEAELDDLGLALVEGVDHRAEVGVEI